MNMAGRGPAPATGRAPARAGRHPDELDLAVLSATFRAQPVAIAGEHEFALTPGPLADSAGAEASWLRPERSRTLSGNARHLRRLIYARHVPGTFGSAGERKSVS
jgi:hypothetical protein